ncbi:MAG: DUF222 domain-containing protein, partial [Candidatus Nanopelagicales bacterium]|nr:DUF222 domain-containing protein [Candidatus Nanopelagicales bacterium]
RIDRFAAVEAAVVTIAETTEPAELRRVLQVLVEQCRPESLDTTAQQLHAKRGLSLSQISNGMFRLDGYLDPIHGARLRDALATLMGRTGRDDTRTPAQRRADALADLLTAAAANHRPGGISGLSVLIDLEDLTDGHGATLEDGSALGTRLYDLLTCTAIIAVILGVHRAGVFVPLALGRGKRGASAAQWTALTARDRGCIRCGRAPRYCHAHHIHHWRHGGDVITTSTSAPTPSPSATASPRSPPPHAHHRKPRKAGHRPQRYRLDRGHACGEPAVVRARSCRARRFWFGLPMSRCTATTIGHITVRGRLTPVNIVLIGMRGVGKTNIARRLSFMSKRPVMSTDVLVEYEQGHTVPDYVAQFGWAAFRDAEFDVVAKLAVMDGLIIDAGGGVVVDLDEAGREVFSTRKVELLKASGTVIFLKGDIGRLAAKVTGDPTRPVLDATRSAVDLMRTRLPFYEAAADVTIDVEGRQRGDIAEEISLRYP